MTPGVDLTGRLILGIDLGTTNSAVAVWDADRGAVRVLPTAAGDLLVPSVVAWDGNAWVAGRAAEAVGAAEPGRAAGSVKRLIGRRAAEPVVGFARAQAPYHVADTAGGDPLREVSVRFGPAGAPQLSAPEVSARVLAELRRVAADALNLPLDAVRDAVVTVPAYFNDYQRRATRLAGELAGLNVVDLLDEPTAAALAYVEPTAEFRWVAVLDLGGGTFDVSVLDAGRTDTGTVFAARVVDGDTYLGGDDVDAALAAWLADQAGATLDRDDPATRDALRRAARAAKEALSTAAETTVEVAGAAKVQVPVAAVEAAARPVLDRVLKIAGRAVRAAGLTWADISEVVLVGGQAYMPALRKAVEGLTGRPPRCERPPELAVALGAGEYARVLARGAARFHENTLVSVIALPLGVRLDDNTFAPLIAANATLPCRSEPFAVTTREDNQPLIRVEVLQGTGEGADDRADRCVSLGTLELDVPPAKAGRFKFDVTFDARRDGTLLVTVFDPERNLKVEQNVVGRQVVAWRAATVTTPPSAPG